MQHKHTLQTYYVSRQFRRAVMLLKSHGVMEDGRFRCVPAARHPRLVCVLRNMLACATYLCNMLPWASHMHHRVWWLPEHTHSHQHSTTGPCRYLAAKCLAEVEQWDECLSLLGEGELDDELQEVRGGGCRWEGGGRRGGGRQVVGVCSTWGGGSQPAHTKTHANIAVQCRCKHTDLLSLLLLLSCSLSTAHVGTTSAPMLLCAC
jgi:hypothetical protein